MSFEDVVNQFLTSLRARRRTKATLAWYGEQFAAFIKWRGEANGLPNIQELELFLAEQHELSHKPATVNARYRALRALLLFCEKRKLLSREQNPVHFMDAPKVPREVRRYVTKGELDALLAAIPTNTWLDLRDRLILVLLWYCGLRLGELTALNVSDIDTAKLEIVVRHGKGQKARIIPFVDEVRRALIAYLFARPEHDDALLSKSDGYGHAMGRMAGEGVRQMLIRQCKRAGVDRLHPHAFRHGFAMWTLNAGVRMTTVSSLMGHSDPAVTAAVYAFTLTTTARREYDEAVSALRKGENA